MHTGEAGTGTAEEQWKAVWSQMVKREGSCATGTPRASVNKPRCLWQQQRGKDKYSGKNAESVRLYSLLEGLRK